MSGDGIGMKGTGLRIRPAVPEDGPQLLEIYAPYVERTAITFEYEVPTEEEFTGRVRHTLSRYPYLVAEGEDGLLGYAYAGPFHVRAAYDWAAETSIYLREDRQKQGVGRALYEALERVAQAQHILNLNACIAVPEVEDVRLTRNSLRFHARMGYRMVGQFHQCGYKFGTWYDMAWMEKQIGAHRVPPAPVIPFSELGAETLDRLGVR